MIHRNLALVLVFLPLAALAAEPRTVTIDDIDKVKGIGHPVISTGGEYVAYEFEKQIHVIALSGADSRAPRAITASSSSASDPYWSRDGDALYFLSNRSGASQVWKLPLDSFGEAVQVTDLERGVETLRLSADETRLLLTYDDQPKDKPEEEGNSDSGVDKRTEPWVIDRLQFKEDAGDGYLTQRPSDHLYVYDLASRALTQVTSGRFAESDAAWSPDGEKIVFISNREHDPDAGYKADLWVIDANPGDDAPLRLTASDDVKSSPAWSPDGDLIAYLTAVDGVYGIHRLAVIPAEGGTPTVLTADLDRWVQDFAFSDDGRWIYFSFDNHGGQHLARVSVSDGRIERLLEGARTISAFDVGPPRNIVIRATNMNDAANLYRLRRDGVQQLTHVNEGYFAGLKIGRKEKVSFESSGRTIVEAFVTKPPDFESGRRYPTVLDIHGGPVGQFTYGYDFGAQFLAANGYVVVQPNPRGSTGRGQAFVNAIYRTWGITDYADVIASIDHVIELGLADPDRLAVTGYSYGGYMTNVVITRTGRFRAAASGAGHSLIAANFGHDIYQRWYNWELGVPWENREAYDRLSPLLRAGEVVTPTIFLGGRDDWNVPILNAELFYQSLRQRGIDSRLVVYPDSHHGGWDPRFEKDYLQRVVTWFDRYVKSE